jgi:hypothetical protein
MTSSVRTRLMIHRPQACAINIRVRHYVACRLPDNVVRFVAHTRTFWPRRGLGHPGSSVHGKSTQYKSIHFRPPMLVRISPKLLNFPHRIRIRFKFIFRSISTVIGENPRNSHKSATTTYS